MYSNPVVCIIPLHLGRLPLMKPILLLLIALALVITAQMRERPSNPIGPTDELIDQELLQNEQTEQTESPPHE